MLCVAVTPNEAAGSLIKFIEDLDITSTGEYWAPRGPRRVFTTLMILWTEIPIAR